MDILVESDPNNICISSNFTVEYIEHYHINWCVYLSSPKICRTALLFVVFAVVISFSAKNRPNVLASKPKPKQGLTSVFVLVLARCGLQLGYKDSGPHSWSVLLRLHGDERRRWNAGAESWRQTAHVVRRVLDSVLDALDSHLHDSRRLLSNICRSIS